MDDAATTDVWGRPDQPPQEFAERLMGNHVGHIYVTTSAGMGCVWYLRRNDVGQRVESFFMHTDNWGQYGGNTSDVANLREFVSGYHHVGDTPIPPV
jgi:hypothetical protein